MAKGTLDDIDEMRREVRQAVAQHGGGHATLFPAPSEMRAEIPVFEPQPKALAGLSRRLKAGAATHVGGILNGGGHATLFPAPSEMRAEIPVFEPQPKALAGLSRRLKAAFDPYAILEPRRMWVEF